MQSSFAKSLEVHPDSPSPYSFVCLPVVVSPASTPHPPITSVFLFLYILRLRSCRLPSVFIRRPCLPSLPEEYETAGSLRSLGVTPVHRYCRPFRHLLAFLPFPGSAGYRSDLLQSISLWDEEGFSSCLTCPCTVLSLPPRRSVMSHRSARAMSCCLRPAAGSSASGSIFFRGHLWVYFHYGPVTRSPSLRWLCQSASSASLSSADAAQAKELLTFAPAGLPPSY